MMTQTVSIRWFIVMIAFVGICCAVVGTVLGAMKASGREHLTVSLLMIGECFYVSSNTERLTACRVILTVPVVERPLGRQSQTDRQTDVGG
jgi:hypothetical protein